MWAPTCCTTTSAAASPRSDVSSLRRFLPPRACAPAPAATCSSLRSPDNSYLSYERRSIVLSAVLSLVLAHVPIANSSESNKVLTIQKEVRSVLSKAKAAGMLRLVFHDSGTFDLNSNSGGMNGSIIYELDRPENAGLSKSVKVLEKAKREIENIQKDLIRGGAKHPLNFVVSWADLIAVAGAEAVSLCGGPTIPVRIGRLDSRTPDAEGKLPEETLDASALKRCFQNKGFSTQELVVLSGAHTIGKKGFGDPFKFDNSYFNILLEKSWISPGGLPSMIGLPSDRALVEDDECLRWINTYAVDQLKFFKDFTNAYIKLVNTGASWDAI